MNETSVSYFSVGPTPSPKDHKKRQIAMFPHRYFKEKCPYRLTLDGDDDVLKHLVSGVLAMEILKDDPEVVS